MGLNEEWKPASPMPRSNDSVLSQRSLEGFENLRRSGKRRLGAVYDDEPPRL